MKKEHGDGLFRLLAPSVAGLLACVVCLCATSWAWFSASVTAAATTIRSASYTVNITITPAVEPTSVTDGVTTYTLAADQQNDAESYAVSETNGVFTVNVPSAGKYIITITPTGNATAGYCKVNFEGKDYYTDKLTDTTLMFEVTGTGGDLIITPTWGTPSQDVLSTGVPLFSDNSPFTQVDEETQQAKRSPAFDFGEEPDEQPTEDKTQEETDGKTDEAGRSGEDENSSGDSESTTPAGGDTPAEGDTGTGTGTETGDSGNPAPDASNATTSATESTQETPSDQTAFRFPAGWNGSSS